MIFELVKFRTMSPPDGRRVTERLTPLGRFLRSTSLDELPTSWNVVKRDMSLVGPRPLLLEYLPLYSPVQARRHEVRPGVTGLAQVSGRNDITWEDKLVLDVLYVDSRSLLLDVSLIVKTLARVLRQEGVTADGEATTNRSTGTRDQVGFGSEDEN